jgi:hypothetical protein
MNAATLLLAGIFILKWFPIAVLLAGNILLGHATVSIAYAPPYPGTDCGTPIALMFYIQCFWLLLALLLQGLIFLLFGRSYGSREKAWVWILTIAPIVLTIFLVVADL